MSIKPWNARSSFIIITQVAALDTALLVQFPVVSRSLHYRMLVQGSALDIYQRTISRELLLSCRQVCSLEFLQSTERPFTTSDAPSRTYYRIHHTRLYIRPLYRSYLNHLLLSLMMMNITCDERVLMVSTLKIFRRNWVTIRSYSRVP